MSSVLKISEAASLGLHTMALLAARPDEILPTRKIAEELGVSEAHLSKVLQRLTKVGLVNATRGARGGYSLGQPSGEVSLLEVYEAIDGPLRPTTCLLGHPKCNGSECILGDLVGDINHQFEEHLAGQKLSDLAGAFRKNGA